MQVAIFSRHLFPFFFCKQVYMMLPVNNKVGHLSQMGQFFLEFSEQN